MQIYGLFFFFARFFLFFLHAFCLGMTEEVSKVAILILKYLEDFEKRQMILGLRQSSDVVLDFLSDLFNLEA